MKVHSVVLLLLLGAVPLGHAASLKAATPPLDEVGGLRRLQTNSTTEVSDSNGTLDAGFDTGGSDKDKRRPGDACCANGKDTDLQTLTFLLTTNGCEGTGVATQGGNKASCHEDGDVEDGPQYKIRVFYQSCDKSGGSGKYLDKFRVDDTFTVSASDNPDGKNEFETNTCLRIYPTSCDGRSGCDAIQEVNIHTSCSAKIIVGENWGAFELESFTVGDDIPEECTVPPFCVNDKPGEFQDEGCNEDCKLCAVEEGGRRKTRFVTPFDGNEGDVCKVCQNDKSGGARDNGCTDDRPLCVARDGEYGDTCASCFLQIDSLFNLGTDTELGDEVTSVGCPVCNPEFTRELTVFELSFGGLGRRPRGSIGAKAYGFECTECANIANDQMHVKGYVDFGCSTSAPLCNGNQFDLLTFYKRVARIPEIDSIDELDNAEITVDESSDADGIEGSREVISALVFIIGILRNVKDSVGTGCFKCQNTPSPVYDRNDVEYDDFDLGCVAGISECKAGEGDFGDECFSCINDAGSEDIDSGCFDGKRACLQKAFCEGGHTCVACINDKKGGHAIDSGCSEGTPACYGNPDAFLDVNPFLYLQPQQRPIRFPISGNGRMTAVPLGEEGLRCVTCVNDSAGASADQGCKDIGFPICVEENGKGRVVAIKQGETEEVAEMEGEIAESRSRNIMQPDLNDPGTKCAKCINDNRGPNQGGSLPNLGCEFPTPFCDDDGDRCFQCRADRDCTEGLCCAPELPGQTVGSCVPIEYKKVVFTDGGGGVHPRNWMFADNFDAGPGCILTTIKSVDELMRVAVAAQATDGAHFMANDQCWVGIRKNNVGTTTGPRAQLAKGWFNDADFSSVPQPPGVSVDDVWEIPEPNNAPPDQTPQDRATVNRNTAGLLRDVKETATFRCAIYKCCPPAPL